MAYFLVMGGLALSASFALGWALWRSLRWLLGCLSGDRGSRKPAKTRKPARQNKRQAAKRSTKADSRRKAEAKPASRPRREPGRFTRWLAGWHAALPLALVASLVYLVARLAEYGLQFRPPHAAPGGYHTIVIVLGWLAAGLLLAGLVQRLAAWRCR
ncbi:hypothetical protein EQG41_10080 [Billgrantia azerbaijanica]|nr:hypothetical protein EQG41_10080 [Halomonas azerbaijanica]